MLQNKPVSGLGGSIWPRWLRPRLIRRRGRVADLRALIEELMALRPGADFALFFVDHGVGEEPWTASFVNPASSVNLGEVGGEFEGGGDTPEEAVRACIANVKAERPNASTPEPTLRDLINSAVVGEILFTMGPNGRCFRWTKGDPVPDEVWKMIEEEEARG